MLKRACWKFQSSLDEDLIIFSNDLDFFFSVFFSDLKMNFCCNAV